jgi:hypothetical protein
MAVVATPTFLREAASVFTEQERTDLVTFLAVNPEAGYVVPETGGVRKIRWRTQGQGKRGAARVIYYYHNESVPLFVLNVFAKNEKANLTRAERNELKKLLPRLVDGYRRRMTR